MPDGPFAYRGGDLSALAVHVFLALAALSTVYWVYAAVRTAAFARRRDPPAAFAPPVTILKPLCGDDPALLDSLRSFCAQDYPRVQIVFAVAEADDPAVRAVHRLMEEYPDRDLTLVVSGRPPGLNPKVVNLANAYACAKHDVIVVADSDIGVGPGYLRTVVGPLADPRVGLVTCLYRGVPHRAFASRLGAMFIDEWFFPSALVAAGLGPVRHAFGATVACRRAVLDAVGGFERLAGYLADDYVLGRRVADQGFGVRISSCVVETRVAAADLRALFRQELRWARTIRAVRPVGYACSAVTYGLAWCALALAASGLSPAAALVTAVHVGVRLAARRAVARALGKAAAPVWLVPVREAFSLLVWAASFAGRNVDWRGRRFAIGGCSRVRGAEATTWGT